MSSPVTPTTAETAPHPVSAPEALPSEVLATDAFTIAFIDHSDDVREYARDAADARLTSELNDGDSGRFRRMVRNVWKGNVARDYYRQKYIRAAEATIVDNSSLYANRDDVNVDARNRARNATINRFISEYEEAIHMSAGERRKDVTQAEIVGEAGAAELITKTKDLIQRYAEGALSDESLREERTRMLDELRRSGGRQQLFGNGVMVADNMIEIAQNVRAALNHGEDIDRVMDRIRVVSGEARSGARTEAQYNRVDKIIDRLNSSRVGSLVNEATLVTAVTVAASMARLGSTKLASAATMTIAPGIGAGLIAGARESKHVKDERRQHAREMATGQEYDQGNARRRDAMQETVYESVTAQSLIEDLAVRVDRDQLVGADETQIRDALNSVLAAYTRVKLSDSEGIDLISYSSVAEVESERLVLDIALAQAKVTLKEVLDAAGEDARDNLAINSDQTLDENLATLSEAQQHVLEQDITQKDSVFKALQRREVAKTAAKAALMGMGMGMVAQEIKAMVDPSTQGVVEQLWHAKNTPIGGRTHETLLHGFLGSNNSSTEVNHHALSGEMHERVFGHGTKVSLSSEYHMQGGRGHYELIGPTGKSVSELTFDPHGALTPESLQKLRELGLTAHDKSFNTTEMVTTTKTVDVNGFLADKQAGTTHVARNLWYDNNTPAPKFDKNELGLQWGGAGNTGVDAQGNYIFNTHAMTYGGSYHAAEQAHWQELAAQGKLKMAFSVTRDTQHQVFMVNIDAQGNAIIPKGSPVAQLFSTQGGHAVYEGKYAEVVQTLGVDNTGTEHVRMLATHIGQDTAGAKPYTIVDHIPKTTTHHSYEIIGKGYNTTQQLSNFIEMAPVIPLYSRKGLENVLANEPTPYHYYNRELTPEEVEGRRARMSPRLQENPDAVLNPQEEVDWYLGQQHANHLDRVHRNLESIPEPMGDNVEMVVTIPVAGHQEADNIYRTLEAYKDQALDTSKYEIMLYVNHPITDRDGNKLNATATLAEIERFRQDNPDMPIRVMYEALPREDANIGYIRKVLVDSVLERNRQRGSADELIIVSNDADAISIHEKYLQKMLEKTLSEGVDATIGQIDWDNKAYVNYPEVHIGTRFFLMVDASLRIRDGRTGSNLGANAAFRASSYAAVGGYREGTEIAEDVDLGLDIRAARDGVEGREVITHGGVNGSRIITSARRAVHTWEQHADAPYHQWNYSFSADDDDIRSIQTGALKPSDFGDPKRRAELVTNVERVINKTLESLHPAGLGATSQGTTSASIGMTAAEEDRLARHIERALHFMGIEFEWAEAGRIKITNGERMLNGLQNYAIRAVRKDMIEQGVPTTGGFMIVNGQMRKANGQFMSKREKEAILANIPRLFGDLAVTGAA